MPPDDVSKPRITGRCYCGRVAISSRVRPETVAYCHCSDCRRWTGGPVAAFAAFDPRDLQVTPAFGAPFCAVPGVERWTCPDCGSALGARFDYLPDQIYVPVGLIDQIADLSPQTHSHFGEHIHWLHIDDTLPRETASARATLSGAKSAATGN